MLESSKVIEHPGQLVIVSSRRPRIFTHVLVSSETPLHVVATFVHFRGVLLHRDLEIISTLTTHMNSASVGFSKSGSSAVLLIACSALTASCMSGAHHLRHLPICQGHQTRPPH